VAATTGGGKTTFMGQVAVHIAKRGVGVLFFSTEMKRDEILLRAVGAESGVSFARLTKFKDRLSANERAKIAEAARLLRGLPFVIDDTPRITIDEIVAATRAEQETFRLVRRAPLGVVGYDYAQRLEPPKHLIHREKHDQI